MRRISAGEQGFSVKLKHYLFLLITLAGFQDWMITPACAAWHSENAVCRRELKVSGEDGTPVTAFTTVFLDDGFTGFVLTDAQGKPRPCSLLQRSGSLCSIHFDAKAGETLYLYPSASTTMPAVGLDHLSGLRHLVRGYDGQAVSNAAMFAELWQRGSFQGGRFTDQVYCSFNPFGDNAKALHQFDGFVSILKPGATTFCLASTDASFLFIDGREVVAWPGNHEVKEGLYGKIRGSVTLEPGLHRFVFQHANSGSDSYAIAAMALPGEQRHFVIAPESFTRAAYAYVGPLMRKEGQRQADFIWDNHYMVNIQTHALYHVLFEAAPLKDAPNAAYAWDFGDGTQGTGLKAEHLYFVRGDTPVTLTVTDGNGHETVCRQTLRVAPIYGQSENDDARALTLLDQAVRQEQESGIQPQGYALITQGYFSFLKEAKAAAFAERVLAAVTRIPEAERGPLLTQLALGVQQVNEQYELSERCFRAILETVKDPATCAAAALHCGGMLNLCLNQPQKARELLATIRRQDLSDWEQRLLDIYLADTALVLDDVAAAQKLYATIPRPTALITDRAIDRIMLFDYNSRTFRLQNLLNQKLFRESLTELDMLEWEVPEERLSPQTNLLKVQALAGNQQPRKAIVCLQRALLANVDASYTPKLRLELARQHLSLNQLVPAKHQLMLIRKESPWTQEELDARKLSIEIERKIEEVVP